MSSIFLTAVGNALGGPVGGQIGSLIGGVIDKAVFSPKPLAPRLPEPDAMQIQSSRYGAPIPLLYGKTRLAGNIIWSTGLLEERNDGEEAGGKGGGGGRSEEDANYIYGSSFAIGISGRPIQSIGRIWADGKLLRDSDGTMAVPGTTTLYSGAENQMPDPVIEGHEGVGDTPAFRGLAYLVFERLALADFGNRLPNIHIEVVADDGPVTLEVLARDIADRVNVWVDAGDRDENFDGIALDGNTSAEQALDSVLPLLPAILVYERSDGAIRLTKRQEDCDRQLDRRTLGSGEVQTPIERISDSSNDLPTGVELQFLDPARDYQLGFQRSDRQQRLGGSELSLSLPLTLQASKARRLTLDLLSQLWRNRGLARFSFLFR